MTRLILKYGVYLLAALVIAAMGEIWLRELAKSRQKLSGVLHLRGEGVEAYPAYTPYVTLTVPHLRWDHRAMQPLTPLGGVANADTVFCYEDSDLITYKSDRFGFRNPNALWDREYTDHLLIGDSFVQGACIAESFMYSSQLSASGGTSLNLGSFGNGPLSNLAMLKEFGSQVKTKKILWFYVPNDLREMQLEMQSFLAQYLRPDFKNAGYAEAEKASIIDTSLRKYLNKNLPVITTERQTGLKSFMPAAISHYLTIAMQRIFRPPPAAVKLMLDYELPAAVIDFQMQQYAQVLRRARGFSQSQGAELLAVFIPDARIVKGGPNAEQGEHLYARWKQTVDKLGIKSFSLLEVMNAQENPFAFYAPLGHQYGHFNREGFQLTGEAIKQWLDTLKSSESNRLHKNFFSHQKK